MGLESGGRSPPRLASRPKGPGMADESEASPLLIVTGSLLRAEEADRPIAYYLRQQVEAKLVELCAPGPPRLRPCVVADFRWLHDDPSRSSPRSPSAAPA